MPEQLLNLLKIFLLVLLYLFFFRVLRAVWTEVNPKTAGEAPPPRPSSPAPEAAPARPPGPAGRRRS